MLTALWWNTRCVHVSISQLGMWNTVVHYTIEPYAFIAHMPVCLFSIRFASPLAFQIRFNLMLFIQWFIHSCDLHSQPLKRSEKIKFLKMKMTLCHTSIARCTIWCRLAKKHLRRQILIQWIDTRIVFIQRKCKHTHKHQDSNKSKSPWAMDILTDFIRTHTCTSTHLHVAPCACAFGVWCFFYLLLLHLFRCAHNTWIKMQ